MKKKFFIGLFVFAAIGLFVFANIVLNKNVPKYEPQQNIKAPIEIPSTIIVQDFSTLSTTKKPSVIMFYVDWCTYCRKFMPVFGEISSQYKDKYNFIAINCDKPENLKYVEEYHIMAFPSLYMYDKEVNHKFSFNMAVTVSDKFFKEELDNYLKVRQKFNLNR